MKKLFLYLALVLSTSLSNAQETIELVDLIKIFAPAQSIDYDMYDWSTAEDDLRIDWITEGADSERKAQVVVSINKKVLHCLSRRKVPCTWGLTLSGPRSGYTTFTISSVNHHEMDTNLHIKQLLCSSDYSAQMLKKCDVSASWGYKLYKVKFKGKKDLWIKYSWGCGTSGCETTIDCYTNKSDIRLDECL